MEHAPTFWLQLLDSKARNEAPMPQSHNVPSDPHKQVPHHLHGDKHNATATVDYVEYFDGPQGSRPARRLFLGDDEESVANDPLTALLDDEESASSCGHTLHQTENFTRGRTFLAGMWVKLPRDARQAEVEGRANARGISRDPRPSTRQQSRGRSKTRGTSRGLSPTTLKDSGRDGGNGRFCDSCGEFVSGQICCPACDETDGFSKNPPSGKEAVKLMMAEICRKERERPVDLRVPERPMASTSTSVPRKDESGETRGRSKSREGLLSNFSNLFDWTESYSPFAEIKQIVPFSTGNTSSSFTSGGVMSESRKTKKVQVGKENSVNKKK